MLGVEGQVRHPPRGVLAAVRRGLLVERLDALLDGVLVATAERGVHQVAHPRMTRVHRQAVAVLGHTAQRVDVGDVEFGIDAVHEQVDRQVDHVDVAGALAIAEQRALHAVGPGQHAHLGCGCGRATIVVRVEADDHAVALDRGRQVEDDGPLGGGVDDVHHRVAHLDGELGLGEGEALGRVLVADLGAGHRVVQLLAHLGAVHSDVDDA